jgi:uncharacterized membrane protein YkoI
MVLATLTPRFAAAAPACLSREQERAAIAEGQAVKLAAAIGSLHGHGGELISAPLCHGAKGLEYVLTLLAHDGKVTRATVDAGSGTVIGRR